MKNRAIQYLISLPSDSVESIAELEGLTAPEWFVGADPKGAGLGSGGGTVNMLLSAWRAESVDLSFPAWLRASQKLLIHGDGQTHFQPAYIALGRPFIPIPVWRWTVGQRLDQKLLNLQLPLLERILSYSHERSRILIASGDVLVRFSGRLPELPEADVVCMGLWVKPEEAASFGVFFCPRENPTQPSFFLQKPSPQTIRAYAEEHFFLVDTGIWLLSERAFNVLMHKSGYAAAGDAPADFTPCAYGLYNDFGSGLGSNPVNPDPEVNPLSVAVVPLPDGDFFHFGSNNDIINSCLRLQNLVLDQRLLRATDVKLHPDLFAQNSELDCRLHKDNHCIWIENSYIPSSWKLTRNHALTGIPMNEWELALEPGVCIEVVSVDDTSNAFRFYGFDDPRHGGFSDPNTTWLGHAPTNWFSQRGINLDSAGVNADDDISHAPLYPVFTFAKDDSGFLQWLISSNPGENQAYRRRFLEMPRISATELIERANLRRLYQQRRIMLNQILPELAGNHRNSVFYRVDLKKTAKLYISGDLQLPTPVNTVANDPMKVVHDRMFRSEVLRARNDPEWKAFENEAFQVLKDAIVNVTLKSPVQPVCNVMEDQIVWGRSPVRLDLAGGWTDTPPFCLLNGGKVLNLAVNLNGQPPLQVFAKRAEHRQIILRSIDLGVEERIHTYEDIAEYSRVGSGFSIAKTALALAGFHPDFMSNAGLSACPAQAGAYPSLAAQLDDFGGGIELSLVAAVPKGSGLGTSSILAATLLGALSDFCGLHWDLNDICNRTLALEQLLTTGGGWQDQAGGVLRSIKLVETQPGLDQTPIVKWLPDQLFTGAYANELMLLYYTGITRVAKGILEEIVRGMFLNSSKHLSILHEIREHAEYTYDVVQKVDWYELCHAVQYSWELNQRLDDGTNPPQVQSILDKISDFIAAAKLLGAGGGGYLLILAKDPDAALRIRRTLTENPPNTKARFVNFSLSTEGLNVTRS